MNDSTPEGPRLRGISSMATRQVLAELAQACAQQGGPVLALESVGGVDAARRVAAGEVFDLVLLASDAVDKLIAAGHARPGRVDLVRSPVTVAVREGAPRPDIATEAALRAAVLAAPSIGYSTGPSGSFLMALFARWGIADAVAGKLVQPPPGVPVARGVAEGAIALGFQQLSELQGVPGVAVLGTLPAGAEFITTFSGAVCTACTQPEAARAWLAWAAAPATAEAKRRHGMGPA